jgi:hypothetical protein
MIGGSASDAEKIAAQRRRHILLAAADRGPCGLDGTLDDERGFLSSPLHDACAVDGISRGIEACVQFAVAIDRECVLLMELRLTLLKTFGLRERRSEPFGAELREEHERDKDG